MDDLASHIPQGEVFLGFLGRSVEIHWDYHAYLMVGIWAVLVPLCITIIRFGKPRPTELGVRKRSVPGTGNGGGSPFTNTVFTLPCCCRLADCCRVVVSQGISGSVHSILGLLTILMGCLQAISGMLRGTHGGKYYYTADPDDPATWHGDHYGRTTRRRIFEAYHKTAGYFAVVFAIGAVGSGLMQYPMPVLAAIVFVLPFAFLTAWVILQYQERDYDGYRAVHGYGLEHPYNKEREFL